MRQDQGPESIERRIEAFFEAERQRLHAPADLWARVASRLGPQERVPWWSALLAGLRGTSLQVAGAAAAVLLLAFGGVMAWRVTSFGTGADSAPAQETTSLAAVPASESLSTTSAIERAADSEDSSAGATAEAAAVAPASAPSLAAMTEPATPWRAILDEQSVSGEVALMPLWAVVRDGRFLVLVYAVTAPESLAGWTLVPQGISFRVEEEERSGIFQGIHAKTMGQVSIGAVSLPLSGDEIGRFFLEVAVMEAVQPETGGARQLDGAGKWVVAPLSREGGGNGVSTTMLLRSSACFTYGGVALDLGGGEACPQTGDVEKLAAGAGLEVDVAEGVDRVLLVFYEPEQRAVVVLVDAEGAVRVVEP